MKKLPNRDAAISKYVKALKSGKLKRQPCEVCGKKKTDGHHPDYHKPLKIMWLCKKHHGKWHGKHGYQQVSLDSLRTIKILKKTNRKMKVLAALENKTIQEYFECMVNKAYEVSIFNERKLKLNNYNYKKTYV